MSEDLGTGGKVSSEAAVEAWQDELLSYRQAREVTFHEGRGPLRGAALTTFAGFSYYPPDPAWAWADLPVRLLGSYPAEVQFATQDGGVKWWGAFGEIVPDLPGLGPQPLTLYTPLGEEQPSQAFLPFRDASSGDETYGLGRYVDVPLAYGAGGSVTAWLDFNRAYHPSCAYGEGFSCPLPPREHWLSVAVPVGERLP